MLMLKVLVSQRLHGLADDATNFLITDRNRFASRLRNRAFLCLTPGDAVPATTDGCKFSMEYSKT